MRLSPSSVIAVFSTLLHLNISLVSCKLPGWNLIGGTRGGATHRKPSLGSRYYHTDDDDDSTHGLTGSGREFDLFSTDPEENNGNCRGGATNSNIPPESSDNSYTAGRAGGRSSSNPAYQTRNRNRSGSNYKASSSSKIRNPFTSVRNWVRDNQASIPRIQVRVEPNTTLKLRKRFSPLFKTMVTLGADFNTQLGVWQFKSSWEDKIIGGRLTLAGRELQLSKTWLLSVGAVEDLVTRLRFRAAIDLGTAKAYARFGFRSERLSPINVMEGFTLLRQLPLDGPEGNVKLEVKANFAFPEPEIEYSTEKGGRSLVGMGDIEVNIDELNLLLEY